MDLISIGVMGLNEAKDFQKKLKEYQVQVELNHNDANCTRGCAVTVELMARESDIPVIQKVYAQEYQKSLAGLEVNPDQMAAVFDPSQDKVMCPACGHEFKPTHNECPSCGLMF